MDFKKNKEGKQTFNKLIDTGLIVDVQMGKTEKNETVSDVKEKYTSPKLIDTGQEVSVSLKIPDAKNKEDENKAKLGGKFQYEDGKLVKKANKNKSYNPEDKYFDYTIFKKIMARDIFKVVEGQQVLLYNEEQGYFEHLNETKLKIYIRLGWDEETKKKLARNVVLEIVERIMTEPTIQVDEDYFNCYPHLMNFWNGTYDVKKDKFMKHSPDYRLTSCIQACFVKHPPKGDTFLKFLKTSLRNNTEKIGQLQEIVAYLLSEYCTCKKIPMIIGEKHSGKSMLNRILTELIGKKHVSHVPLHKLGDRFVLSNLFMKKANISSEIGDDPLSNIDIVKGLSGGDDMLTEFKGKDHFSYRSKIKLMFSGNHEPKLKNRDVASAFYDRITFVNFSHTIPEHERDHNMEEKILENDRSYIVWWAIKGLKRLMENNFVFTESEESIKFKKRYIIEQNNTIDFIKSHCEFGTGYKVHLKALYGRYISYCHQNCFKEYDKENFFAEISKHKVEKKKFRIGGSDALWGYRGMKLIEDELEDELED